MLTSVAPCDRDAEPCKPSPKSRTYHVTRFAPSPELPAPPLQRKLVGSPHDPPLLHASCSQQSKHAKVQARMEQTKALNALEPFLALSKSATSPRAAADLIAQATSAPNTYVFAELLRTPNIQKLRDSTEHAPHLRLLEIFAWGTWEDYKCTPAYSPFHPHKLTLPSAREPPQALRPAAPKAAPPLPPAPLPLPHHPHLRRAQSRPRPAHFPRPRRAHHNSHLRRPHNRHARPRTLPRQRDVRRALA